MMGTQGRPNEGKALAKGRVSSQGSAPSLQLPHPFHFPPDILGLFSMVVSSNKNTTSGEQGPVFCLLLYLLSSAYRSLMHSRCSTNVCLMHE